MTRLAVASAVAFVAAVAAPAHADLRSFTHTYEYSTVPEGRTAIELWHTQGRMTWDKSTPQFFEQILEIEHGITDHWDAAVYTVFQQATGDATTPAQPFTLASTRFETRYRFADRGVWPVDTEVYLEVAKDFGRSVYEIEGKLILARDFDKVTAAVNAIGELEVGNDVKETEAVVGWAAGLTYSLSPRWRLGAETFGQYEEEKLAASAGPALSWAAASNFWVTATAGFGITDEADAFSARAIVGIEL